MDLPEFLPAPPETCGATAVFWPDAEACDAVCRLPVGHQPPEVHEDDILGEWTDDDQLSTRHADAEVDQPPVVDPPFRLELWRVDPLELLRRFVLASGERLSYMPQPWDQPVGWPHGYEWRQFDASGYEVGRWSVSRESAVVTYEDPDAGLD